MKIIEVEKVNAKNLNEIFKSRKRTPSYVENLIKEIIKNVRSKGDKSVISYIEKYDKIKLDKSKLKVKKQEILDAYTKISKDQLHAFKIAIKNIHNFHKIQKDRLDYEEQINTSLLGQKATPINSVGIYAPSGRNPYPSSVLMCAVPAKVADVKKIILCTPPIEEAKVEPTILVAADLSGVDEIYRVGGAQAIAAMAYGTETIPSVNKIVGPGNIYVTTAKLLVSRDVAIDLPAGPSELLIIADSKANTKFITSDMLAQAEHDPNSIVVLITTSKKISEAVLTEIENQKKTLSRKEILESAIDKNGFIVLVNDINDAIDVANEFAPEHLEIFTKKPMNLLNRIKNAGAIFLGEYSPVALGDYTIGTNHVLPTGGWAKIYSGLSTRDFMKTISYIYCSLKHFNKIAEATISLAKLEGLDGHVESIRVRRKTK
ncbi:MAG: histidinol dehydrogenase [Candidatus Bathyarchaeota archaeon]|nr:histidinol dehydrogenase [Candidatus Bathyarchaeota archaeon]